MPPFQRNDTYNMSPVITELFLLFRSMVNIQIVVCANGIVKCILKYVGKFDEGNRVIAHANAHTGAIQVRSQCLHNTKIDSSKWKENKAHNISCNKNLPTGIARPVLELYQLMIIIPEVTINLFFVDYSTLSLEVRMKENNPT